MTLYRLALNVASTRLILLDGDAGQVITSFGQFVVGGNYIVGAVVFLILVIVNFMVITKVRGASPKLRRVSRWMRCRASRWQSTRS